MIEKRGILLALVLLLSAVAALGGARASVQQVVIEDRLSEDMTLNESVDIILVNNADAAFSVMIPAGARDILLNSTPVAWNSTLDIPLNCTSCLIHLDYAMDGMILKENTGHFLFSRTLNLPQAPMSIQYTVDVPPGYIIDIRTNDSDPPIVPKATDIRTNGKNIIILWSEKNPVLPKRYFVDYIKHEPRKDMMDMLTSELTSWGLTINLVYLMIGLIIGFTVGRKIGRKRIHLPFIPSDLLTPDEKQIVKVLKSTREKMSQKEIGRALNWSKSKVSAIMFNLEHKKIVKRERFGRNYRTELIKDVDTTG